jgi:hypothetical protein
VVLGQAVLEGFSAGAAQALAGQLDAMGVVDEAVQDGVGVGGVSDNVVPGGHWELGGDDRRSAAISLLEDFEEVVTGAGVEGLEAEVVEDEEIGAAEGFDEAWMSPVAPGERKVAAELRPAMIENRAIVAAGSVADGAGEPAFADAGRPDEREIVVGVDPFACRELLEERAIEPSGSAIVYVFDARLLAEFCGAQPIKAPALINGSFGWTQNILTLVGIPISESSIRASSRWWSTLVTR